jgi:hypothetical protein
VPGESSLIVVRINWSGKAESVVGEASPGASDE